MIRLEAVNPENWRLGLKVSEKQKSFASDDMRLLARAYAFREYGSRAFVIYSGETPVGMALYYDCEELKAYDFSQLFIDERYQGRGYGIEAAGLILNMMTEDGRFDKVILCYIDGNEAAKNMYEKLGFYLTGERDGDEIIMEKILINKKMEYEKFIELEPLTRLNIDSVRKIQREDISEDFADNADTIMEITQYGADHGCIGDTYAVKYKSQYIGVILLGEAIPWETDPPQMKEAPFYRLMGFVIDKRYRGMGIGSYVLEKAIDTCYKKYGVRPIALGCHKDNAKAAEFYLRHGFKKTQYMEGSDYYYLRLINERR